MKKKPIAEMSDNEYFRKMLLDQKAMTIFTAEAVKRNEDLDFGSTRMIAGHIVKNNVEQVYEKCESPIETMFFAAVVTHFAIRDPLGLLLSPHPKSPETKLYKMLPPLWDTLHLGLQIPMAPFEDLPAIRPDGTAWIPSKGGAVFIECDGYEFHSSKDRFVADRIRDRKLQAQGFSVLRFSGSEIHADVLGTAASFLGYLEKAYHG